LQNNYITETGITMITKNYTETVNKTIRKLETSLLQTSVIRLPRTIWAYTLQLNIRGLACTAQQCGGCC